MQTANNEEIENWEKEEEYEKLLYMIFCGYGSIICQKLILINQIFIYNLNDEE